MLLYITSNPQKYFKSCFILTDFFFFHMANAMRNSITNLLQYFNIVNSVGVYIIKMDISHWNASVFLMVFANNDYPSLV